MQQFSERDGLSVVFSEVRLPRPAEVEYPAALDDLEDRAARGDIVLVAEDDGVAGCLAMSGDAAGSVACVDHLLVSPDKRRRGLGTGLLREGVKHARQAGLRAVIASCLATNGPAIAFYQRLGLEFCGYNEQRYADHQVTLLFAYRI